MEYIYSFEGEHLLTAYVAENENRYIIWWPVTLQADASAVLTKVVSYFEDRRALGAIKIAGVVQDELAVFPYPNHPKQELDELLTTWLAQKPSLLVLDDDNVQVEISFLEEGLSPSRMAAVTTRESIAQLGCIFLPFHAVSVMRYAEPSVGELLLNGIVDASAGREIDYVQESFNQRVGSYAGR
jgi:hypothetical protein